MRHLRSDAVRKSAGHRLNDLWFFSLTSLPRQQLVYRTVCDRSFILILPSRYIYNTSARTSRLDKDCWAKVWKRSRAPNSGVRSRMRVPHTHTLTHTHMNRPNLTVLWIGFCLTRPISPCLGSFVCTYVFSIWLYTLSQKTSRVWLAIILTYMIRLR